MKRTNKALSLILLAAIVSANLAACGGGAGSSETTAGDTTTAPVTESIAELLGFDKEDNGGKTFTMLINTSKDYEYNSFEETGDVVDDAVFAKNTAVEEYLGIDLELVIEDGNWNNRNTFNGLITSDVMSGSQAYDIVSGITVCTMPIVADGYFLDGKGLPNVQFDKPWWIANMYDRFSVAGKLYAFIGDASLSLYKDMNVIYFNKRIIEEFDRENPYDLVREGKWTLDKFIEYSSGMEKDLNGDGEIKTETDQLSFLGEYVPCGTFQTSLQLEVVRIGKDGTPEYLGLSEKYLSAYQRLYKFMFQKGSGRLSSIDDQSWKSMKNFANGTSAIMCNFVYATEHLRDMKDDYGILPMPKYDENQENYVTQLGTSTAALFVPTTTKDVALTSKVMEAMSYYTMKMVVPNYYEVALKDKYARDTDMAEMLDIIRAGATFDFLFAYGTSLDSAPNSHFRFYDGASEDIASSFAGNETKFTASLEKMIEKIAALDH